MGWTTLLGFLWELSLESGAMQKKLAFHTYQEVPIYYTKTNVFRSISGLVVEYIVAIDVTRVRFPADALLV